jgi:hypothetical protein
MLHVPTALEAECYDHAQLNVPTMELKIASCLRWVLEDGKFDICAGSFAE